MSIFDNNEKKNKQPSLFGIPLSEQSSEANNGGQLFGISIAPVDDTNSTPYYLTPAITQSLNLLELTLQKTTFDKADFEILRSTLSLLPITEISRLRSTISVASLDNLSKKADIFEKTQTIEIEKSTLPNQKEENKDKYLDKENDLPKHKDLENFNPNQKLLSKEEINKLMANFLSERNDLVQNMEEKNKQVSLESNKQNNLSN
jgi:hypothetical protein